MKKTLLEHIACPQCGASLVLEKKYILDEEEVVQGRLSCAVCRRYFFIRNYIPRFVIGDNYAVNFGFQWNLFRKTQLDSFTKTGVSRKRFFEQSHWEPTALEGKLVLDAGCGAGRFAEIALSAGATVIAVDYSCAVDACRENLKGHPNMHVLQADIYALPFKPETFDYAYSFGVLQHTPDVKRAFFAILEKVKKHGNFCIDCYVKDWRIYFWPKYWLRPFLKNLPRELLFKIVEMMVPFLTPVSNQLIKAPKIGHYLRYILPVVNYRGIYPLDEERLREWAILDTFDMFSPKYDNPQTPKTIEQWFRESRCEEIEIFAPGLVIGRARK